METGTCSDGAFRYKDKEYYFCHSFDDDTYHFGVVYKSKYTDQEFASFDDIMDAILVGDKPFREMLPHVVWY